MSGALRVVTDTSVLIAFGGVGRLDILQVLFGQVLVPSEVIAEAGEKVFQGQVGTALRSASFIRIANARQVPRTLLDANLDAGELAALALALERSAHVVLIDELHARRIAREHGLAVLGTIGCLVRAKHAGLLSAVRPVLDAMREKVGFWVKRDLYVAVLSEEGEWA